MRGVSARLALTGALLLAACSRTSPEAVKAELASRFQILYVIPEAEGEPAA